MIGYAGRGPAGGRKWYLHWFRSAQRVSTPDVLYDSPLEALKVAEEFLDALAQLLIRKSAS